MRSLGQRLLDRASRLSTGSTRTQGKTALKTVMGAKVLLAVAIAGAMALTLSNRQVYSEVAEGLSGAISAMGRALSGESASFGEGRPSMPETLTLPERLTVNGTGGGYLPASWDVTSAGAFSYRIPLDVPAGRAGMQPELGLGYSSEGSNGLLGIGWSVSGLSSITRCSKTLSSDGKVDGPNHDDQDPDNFCLDGAKLVLIANNLSGTEQEYRTEYDQYARITSSTVSDTEGGSAPGPGKFIVETNSGLIREYSPFVAHRVAATVNNLTDLGPVRNVWMLTSEKDRSGNEVKYSYQTTTSGAANEGLQILPDRIDYTFHAASGALAQRYVKFVYEDQDRPDIIRAWRAATRSDLAKRLQRIVMYAPNPTTTEAVWKYEFAYETSPDTGRSRLKSVEKCANLSLGAIEECTWAKEFTWSTRGAPQFTEHSAGMLANSLNVNAFESPYMHVFDANGDGLDDILVQAGSADPYTDDQLSNLYLGQRLPDGTAVPLGDAIHNEFVFTKKLKFGRAIDLDRDGRSELCWPRGNCYQWNAASETLEDGSGYAFTPGFNDQPQPQDDHTIANFIDFDGDGLPDLLQADLEESDTQTRWYARYNTGNGAFHTNIQAPMSTPIVDFAGSRPLRAIDLDGDGRGDAIHGPEALSLNDAGQFVKFPTGSVANEAFTSSGAYGDFNGDGLRDRLILNSDTSQAVIATNTGNGFHGQQVLISNLAFDFSIPGGVKIVDVNRDGRDDIVSFKKSFGDDVTVLLSQADGSFQTTSLGINPGTPVPAGSGYYHSTGWTTSQLGDFNGDGLVDIVTVVNSEVKYYLQAATNAEGQANGVRSDLLTDIRDEYTTWPRESITYSTKWSDKPEAPAGACTYPLQCVKGGLTVVRSVTSRAHLVDPDPADTLVNGTKSRTMHYSYEDPVKDLRGRDFLGFSKRRVFDAARGSETITTYDNRTRLSNPSYPGIGYYPYALRPKTVRTVTPILTSAQIESQVAIARARVTQSDFTHIPRLLNQDKTYVVNTERWKTEEWEEEAVGIDWGNLEDTNPGADRVSDVDQGGSPLRNRNGSTTYDDYGNALEATEETIGGVKRAVVSMYNNLTANWLIGLLRTQAVTVTENDPNVQPVTRRSAFDYFPDSGQLHKAYVEKNNVDADIPVTTTYDYDAQGLMVHERSEAAGATPREIFVEFDPFPGQQDEGVYPSQVWSPHAMAQYQPSTWLAIHPALGVLSAAMDANGVQVSVQYDHLGRAVHQEQDGESPVDIAYDGRSDEAGGLNGLIITAVHDGQLAQIISDAMGQAIRTTHRAFDGTFTHSDAEYDRLGRVVVQSRPYTQGTPVQDLQYTLASYDSLDRMLEEVRPDNSKITHSHSFFETHSFDAEDNESYVTRDIDGRLASSVNALKKGQISEQITTSYAYAPFNLLRKITDANGNETVRTFDVRGRITQETDPDTGTTEPAYNGFSDLLKTTHNGSGKVTTLAYDDLGRLTGITNDDGLTSFVWDTQPNGIGKLANATSPDSVSTTFQYDNAGRQVGFDEVVDGIAHAMSWKLDAQNGRLLETRYPSIDGSANPGLILQYQYNNAEYLNEIGYRLTANGAYTKLWNVLARNADAALTEGAYGNGMTATRQYKALTGQLERLLTKDASNTNLMDLRYTYYDNGLVKERLDDTSMRFELFKFDSLLRLTEWGFSYTPPGQGTMTKAQHYTYDKIGNLTDVKESSDSGATWALTEHNTYGSGIVNGATVQPHTLTNQELVATSTNVESKYDERGRREISGLQNVVFTEFNLPRTVTKKGENGHPDSTWTFKYNAFGQRVKKTGPEGTTVSIGGAYELRTSALGTKHVFHVEGTDGVVAQIERDNGSTPVVNYVLEDMLGSVGATVDPSGNVTRFYNEPFGKRIAANGTPIVIGASNSMKRGFTGHEMEDALGLINMKGRMYDPSMRRFISADPISSPWLGQSLNRYSYVMNSPLNLTDPSGYMWSGEWECLSSPGGCMGGGGGGSSGQGQGQGQGGGQSTMPESGGDTGRNEGQETPSSDEGGVKGGGGGSDGGGQRVLEQLRRGGSSDGEKQPDVRNNFLGHPSASEKCVRTGGKLSCGPSDYVLRGLKNKNAKFVFPGSKPPAVQQDETWMCWAAALESWLKENRDKNQRATQHQLSDGYSNLGAGGIDGEARNELAKNYAMKAVYSTTDKFSPAQLFSLLEQHGQVVLQYKVADGPPGSGLVQVSHAVVVYGMVIPPGGMAELYIMDPRTGTHEKKTFYELLKNPGFVTVMHTDSGPRRRR